MNKKTVDRITEVLAVLCVAAALAILGGQARTTGAGETLAGLRVQQIGDLDLERFTARVREVRREIDSNTDPGPSLARLKADFSGRHEVWALNARYEESAGRDGEALVSYARAVRLEPDYLDENSGLYLGGRIQGTMDRVMEDLLEARSGGSLSEQEKDQLKASYFLKRRLAGGCE